MQDLINEYNKLVEDYNSLVDDYNTILQDLETLNNKYNDLVRENKNLLNEYNNLECVSPEWEQLLRDFANSHPVETTYDWYNYNCVDYSRDAVEMLREHGYDARQVRGHCKGDPPNINHAWVELCLWYEPQTGELIKKDKCSINM